MGAGRQQDGLPHEERIVQRTRSRRLRSARKATERQAVGKFRISRSVVLIHKLQHVDLLREIIVRGIT